MVKAELVEITPKGFSRDRGSFEFVVAPAKGDEIVADDPSWGYVKVRVIHVVHYTKNGPGDAFWGAEPIIRIWVEAVPSLDTEDEAGEAG